MTLFTKIVDPNDEGRCLWLPRGGVAITSTSEARNGEQVTTTWVHIAGISFVLYCHPSDVVNAMEGDSDLLAEWRRPDLLAEWRRAPP